MGIFNKKPSIPVCGMCGKTHAEGCGDENKHVVRISIDAPAWLPANLRAQAVGEYTWLCTRCHAFPEMKWPGEGGAWAGLTMHLGKVHSTGRFGSSAMGMRVDFDMRPVR